MKIEHTINLLWKTYLNLQRKIYFPHKKKSLDNLFFRRNAKTKKFLQTNEIFPIESYLKLLDFVDRPNPALTRDMRTSLTKSAMTLSVRISLS